MLEASEEKEEARVEELKRDRAQNQSTCNRKGRRKWKRGKMGVSLCFSMPVLYLVGDCYTTLPGIKDGEFVGLGVGIHDDLEEAFVLFTATV